MQKQVFNYSFLGIDFCWDCTCLNGKFFNELKGASKLYFGSKSRKIASLQVNVEVKHDTDFAFKFAQSKQTFVLKLPYSSLSFSMLYNNLLLASYIGVQYISSKNKHFPYLMLHGCSLYDSNKKAAVLVLSDPEVRGKTFLSCELTRFGLNYLCDEYIIVNLEKGLVFSPKVNYLTLHSDYKRRVLHRLQNYKKISSFGDMEFYQVNNSKDHALLDSKNCLILILETCKDIKELNILSEKITKLNFASYYHLTKFNIPHTGNGVLRKKVNSLAHNSQIFCFPVTKNFKYKPAYSKVQEVLNEV